MASGVSRTDSVKQNHLETRRVGTVFANPHLLVFNRVGSSQIWLPSFQWNMRPRCHRPLISYPIARIAIDIGGGQAVGVHGEFACDVGRFVVHTCVPSLCKKK